MLYDEVVFDFTLPLFVIVYGTTGMAHLKVSHDEVNSRLSQFCELA